MLASNLSLLLYFTLPFLTTIISYMQSSLCSYSGFGQPQAFSFQQSRAVSGGPGSANDMQNVSQMSIDLSSTEFPSLTNRAVPQSSLPSIRNYGESLTHF